jgi:proteasome lid subunit RPN8/RPN11
MDVVHLSDAARADMIAHARAEAPRECCGLLIGQAARIDESVRIRNIHANPARYLLDPAEHIATNRRLRGSGHSVVGCYHSHPHSPAIPSDTDRAEAYYSEFVWMIVSLAVPDVPEVAAYRLRNGEFVTIEVLRQIEDNHHANH